MLWSATWPKEVEAIAADFLKDPYRVIIGSTELKANHRIAQHFIFLQEAEKYSRLTKLLEKEMDGSKVLVFCETKRGCDGVCIIASASACLYPVRVKIFHVHSSSSNGNGFCYVCPLLDL